MHRLNIFDLKLYGIKWEFVQNNTEQAKIHISKPITTNDINLVSIKSFKQIITQIQNFNHPLKQFTKKTILPKLQENNLLIITDMPTQDDYDNNEIFSGEAGLLLKKMLLAINIDISKVPITPLIFWKTLGGQIPNNEDLSLTKPFIDKIISLVNPKIILMFGNITCAELLNTNLLKDNGNLLSYKNIKAIPTYHPNYLLEHPKYKKNAWMALQCIQKILQEQTI